VECHNLGLIDMVAVAEILVVILLVAPPCQPASEEPNEIDRSNSIGGFSSEPDMMCGPNCLWQISRAFGKSYSLGAVKYMTGMTIKDGTTVAGILDAAQAMGLKAIAVKTDVAALARDRRPAILLLRLVHGNHYVILDKAGENSIRLLDADKFRSLSKDDLASIWDGYAILIGQGAPPNRWGPLGRFGVVLRTFGCLMILGLGTYGSWYVWPRISCRLTSRS
jgi:hypothetical protein